MEHCSLCSSPTTLCSSRQVCTAMTSVLCGASSAVCRHICSERPTVAFCSSSTSRSRPSMETTCAATKQLVYQKIKSQKAEALLSAVPVNAWTTIARAAIGSSISLGSVHMRHLAAP